MRFRGSESVNFYIHKYSSSILLPLAVIGLISVSTRNRRNRLVPNEEPKQIRKERVKLNQKKIKSGEIKRGKDGRKMQRRGGLENKNHTRRSLSRSL